MSKFIDYTGQKIGRLTFISHYNTGYKNRWEVICDCGNHTNYRVDYISKQRSRGRIFECSNCKKLRRCPFLPNSKTGRWTIIKRAVDNSGKAAWLCECECGTRRIKTTSDLKGGSSKSCGCYARKIRSKWVNDTQYPPAHGLRSSKATVIKNAIYHTRSSMVSKCYNSKDLSYDKFGKNGFIVCDLWKNGAKDFYNWCLNNGWKEGSMVQIREGCKIFCPENCFFSTRAQNTKKCNERLITWNGETLNEGEWAKKLGCSQACLSERLKRYQDMGIDKAMDLSYRRPRRGRNSEKRYSS